MTRVQAACVRSKMSRFAAPGRRWRPQLWPEESCALMKNIIPGQVLIGDRKLNRKAACVRAKRSPSHRVICSLRTSSPRGCPERCTGTQPTSQDCPETPTHSDNAAPGANVHRNRSTSRAAGEGNHNGRAYRAPRDRDVRTPYVALLCGTHPPSGRAARLAKNILKLDAACVGWPVTVQGQPELGSAHRHDKCAWLSGWQLLSLTVISWFSLFLALGAHNSHLVPSRSATSDAQQNKLKQCCDWPKMLKDQGPSPIYIPLACAAQ